MAPPLPPSSHTLPSIRASSASDTAMDIGQSDGGIRRMTKDTLIRWTAMASKGGIGTCVAIEDCIAAGDEDLMFLVGDKIQVIGVLGEGIYLGLCEGVLGRFSGTQVQFDSSPTNPNHRTSTASKTSNVPSSASMPLSRSSTINSNSSTRRADDTQTPLREFTDETPTVLPTPPPSNRRASEPLRAKVEEAVLRRDRERGSFNVSSGVVSHAGVAQAPSFQNHTLEEGSVPALTRRSSLRGTSILPPSPSPSPPPLTHRRQSSATDISIETPTPSPQTHSRSMRSRSSTPPSPTRSLSPDTPMSDRNAFDLSPSLASATSNSPNLVEEPPTMLTFKQNDSVVAGRTNLNPANSIKKIRRKAVGLFEDIIDASNLDAAHTYQEPSNHVPWSLAEAQRKTETNPVLDRVNSLSRQEGSTASNELRSMNTLSSEASLNSVLGLGKPVQSLSTNLNSQTLQEGELLHFPMPPVSDSPASRQFSSHGRSSSVVSIPFSLSASPMEEEFDKSDTGAGDEPSSVHLNSPQHPIQPPSSETPFAQRPFSSQLAPPRSTSNRSLSSNSETGNSEDEWDVYADYARESMYLPPGAISVQGLSDKRKSALRPNDLKLEKRGSALKLALENIQGLKEDSGSDIEKELGEDDNIVSPGSDVWKYESATTPTITFTPVFGTFSGNNNNNVNRSRSNSYGLGSLSSGGSTALSSLVNVSASSFNVASDLRNRIMESRSPSPQNQDSRLTGATSVRSPIETEMDLNRQSIVSVPVSAIGGQKDVQDEFDDEFVRGDDEVLVIREEEPQRTPVPIVRHQLVDPGPVFTLPPPALENTESNENQPASNNIQEEQLDRESIPTPTATPLESNIRPDSPSISVTPPETTTQLEKPSLTIDVALANSGVSAVPNPVPLVIDNACTPTPVASDESDHKEGAPIHGSMDNSLANSNGPVPISFAFGPFSQAPAAHHLSPLSSPDISAFGIGVGPSSRSNSPRESPADHMFASSNVISMNTAPRSTTPTVGAIPRPGLFPQERPRSRSFSSMPSVEVIFPSTTGYSSSGDLARAFNKMGTHSPVLAQFSSPGSPLGSAFGSPRPSSPSQPHPFERSFSPVNNRPHPFADAPITPKYTESAKHVDLGKKGTFQPKLPSVLLQDAPAPSKQKRKGSADTPKISQQTAPVPAPKKGLRRFASQGFLRGGKDKLEQTVAVTFDRPPPVPMTPKDAKAAPPSVIPNVESSIKLPLRDLETPPLLNSPMSTSRNNIRANRNASSPLPTATSPAPFASVETPTAPPATSQLRRLKSTSSLKTLTSPKSKKNAKMPPGVTPSPSNDTITSPQSKSTTLPPPVSHRDFEDETQVVGGLEFEIVKPLARKASMKDKEGGVLNASDLSSSTSTSASNTVSAAVVGGGPVDEWGFYLNGRRPSLVSTNSAGEVMRSLEARWLSTISTSPASASLKSKKVKKLVLESTFPPSLRGRIWDYLSESKSTMSRPGLYETLSQRANSPPAGAKALHPGLKNVIQKDVEKAFRDHENFNPPRQGRKELNNVLMAYAMLNPVFGYYSSMTLIAGCLLIHTPAEDSFWLLTTLMDRMKGYFAGRELKVDAIVLMGLVDINDKPLGQRLFGVCKVDLQKVLEAWLLPMFVRVLPWPTMLRVWDLTLYLGQDFLLRIALSILLTSSPRLLDLNTLPTTSHVNYYLYNLPQDQLLAADSLIEKALSLKWKDDELKKYRLKATNALNDAAFHGPAGNTNRKRGKSFS